jgi:dolichyl-phosphate beta-glucosyltransferase
MFEITTAMNFTAGKFSRAYLKRMNLIRLSISRVRICYYLSQRACFASITSVSFTRDVSSPPDRRPVSPPRVGIVVPCYNEGKRLPVAQFLDFLNQDFLKTCDINFLFVDDGSRDNTREVLASLQTARPDRITPIIQPQNRGKAETVRNGICTALDQGFEYVGFWDADLATPLNEIPNFMAALAQRPELDMVLGARVKLLGREVQRKAARHYLGRGAATYISLALGLDIYDSQCGAKIFRVRPNTRALFDRPFMSRWVFDVEILARYLKLVGPQAASRGIYELPLHTWIDVDGSKISPKDYFISLWDVLRIRRAYL